MQLITNYNIKPNEQDKTGTTVGKTESIVQSIGNQRVTATTPKDLNLGKKAQSRRDTAYEPTNFHTQISTSRVDFLTPSKQSVAGHTNEGGDDTNVKAKKKKLYTKYKLKSVVHHLGFHAFSGHYITDVRKSSEGDLWYRYDDTTVKEVNRALTKMKDERSAYLAFYILQE